MNQILLNKKKILWLGLAILLLPLLGKSQVQLEEYTLGNGLRFTGKNDYNIVLTGFAQPYFESKLFTDTAINSSFNRFRVRRLRIRLTGDAAQQKITWRLQFDLSGNDEDGDAAQSALMDAWIGYEPIKNFRIRIGQKNTPTDNRELLTRSHTLQLVERSRVTSAFGTIREFGVFVDGSMKTKNGRYIRPSLAITNGDGLNVFAADFGGLKYGGRIDFLPFGTFSNLGQYQQADLMRELTPKLVIGGAYSINKGVSSRRGRASGTILYLDSNGDYLLPDFSKLCIDFMFKWKGFSALGEFVSTKAQVPEEITQRVRIDGTTSDVFDVSGVQDVENYIKGRMMLGKGYNFQMGYIFKNRISVDGQYTFIDADEYSFLNNGTFYNRPYYYTLGLSKYFTKMYGFKVQTSATFVDAAAGSNDLSGNPMNGDEWIFRVITSIAF
jgi:hypothetical protein